MFTNNGGTWTQQGSKLVGSGWSGNYVEQGSSVALSANGGTALIGGPSDNSGIGAVWVFTRPTATAATHDFNVDGKSDIFWRDNQGDNAIWGMSGGTILGGTSLGNIPTNWSVVGTRDFNGDGVPDLLWRDTAGDVWIWLMTNVPSIAGWSVVGNEPTTWSVAGTGDLPTPATAT